MNYLVTGGAGFIGSNLVDALIEAGHYVRVIDNESSDSNSQFYWNDRADNHKVDITDYAATRPLYDGIDMVFHLAAESRIQPSIVNPLKAVHTNVVGTATVLQCSREAGVKRVIYSSTSSAYGLNNNPPLKETMPTDCLNPYSVSKVAGEALCKMYSTLFGLETIVFRYFNVYGERQPVKGAYAPVVGLFIRQKKAGEKLTIVGDGMQRRDFTHVSDVVRANILASQFVAPLHRVENEIIYRRWEWGQIYNIGNGKNCSVLDLANWVGGEMVHLPERKGESRVTLADNTKARNELKWTPKVSIEDWIRENR